MITEKLMLSFMMATIHLLMIIATTVCPKNATFKEAMDVAEKFMGEAERILRPGKNKLM
jgi:hypothetical protein